MSKSIRVFQNPFLEKLTHVHPIMPLTIWLPIIVACYYTTFVTLKVTAAQALILSTFAFFIWTLSEYVLHRVVFHYPAKSKFGQRLVFLFHGIHHDDPHDATRLVMPPVPGLLLGGGFFLSFRVLCGPVWVYPFFAGYIIGYLVYDYTHFAIHHLQPRTSVGKYLKKYHFLHHFKDSEAKWGVSSPLWDYIFATTEMRGFFRAEPNPNEDACAGPAQFKLRR